MSQNGTLDYVNENGLDIETAAATMNVEGTTATLSSDVQMQPQVCIYTFNLKDFNSDISATKLEITAGTDSYTITPTESTNKLTVALKPVSNADFTFAATAIGRLYTKQSVTLTNCTADNVGDVFDKDGNIYNVTNGVEVIYSATFSGKTLGGRATSPWSRWPKPSARCTTSARNAPPPTWRASWRNGRRKGSSSHRNSSFRAKSTQIKVDFARDS
jgi:hypothetical protein